MQPTLSTRTESATGIDAVRQRLILTGLTRRAGARPSNQATVVLGRGGKLRTRIGTVLL